MKTTFQIIEIDEDLNQEVVFSEVCKTKRLQFSIIAMFKAFEGRNVKLIGWVDGEKEHTVLGRGGVLTAAGKVWRDLDKEAAKLMGW